MMRWRLLLPLALGCLVGIVYWILHVQTVGRWLEVHLGIINEPGPYYGFWSGFGSDIAELGILGAIGTGVYQLVRRYNCNYPGCWRIGAHPAAGGQFLLCYRHHPDLAGIKLNQALILDLHRQHQQAQAQLHQRVQDIHQHLQSGRVGPAQDKMN